MSTDPEKEKDPKKDPDQEKETRIEVDDLSNEEVASNSSKDNDKYKNTDLKTFDQHFRILLKRCDDVLKDYLFLICLETLVNFKNSDDDNEDINRNDQWSLATIGKKLEDMDRDECIEVLKTLSEKTHEKLYNKKNKKTKVIIKGMKFFNKVYKRIDPEKRVRFLNLFKEHYDRHRGNIVTTEYEDYDWILNYDYYDDKKIDNKCIDKALESPIIDGNIDPACYAATEDVFKITWAPETCSLYLTHFFRMAVYVADNYRKIDKNGIWYQQITEAYPTIFLYHINTIFNCFNSDQLVDDDRMIINENILKFKNILGIDVPKRSMGAFDDILGMATSVFQQMQGDNGDAPNIDGSTLGNALNGILTSDGTKNLIDTMFNNISNAGDPNDMLSSLAKGFQDPEFKKGITDVIEEIDDSKMLTASTSDINDASETSEPNDTNNLENPKDESLDDDPFI